jgi:hypothetical protein
MCPVSLSDVLLSITDYGAPRVRACKRSVGTPFPAGVTSTGLPGPPELLGLVFESSSLAVVGPSTVALFSIISVRFSVFGIWCPG